MNPEIQKELLNWLQAARGAVETGATFAKEQIPQVLWEKIFLDRTYYTGLIVFFVVVAIISLRWKKFLWQWAANNALDSNGVSYVLALITIGCPWLIAFIILCNTFYSLIMVWFAPRLYLIEWVKGMVK